jgi:hypothetical protein
MLGESASVEIQASAERPRKLSHLPFSHHSNRDHPTDASGAAPSVAHKPGYWGLEGGYIEDIGAATPDNLEAPS